MHTQPLERVDQGMRKAVQPVAMRDDALALHIVEHFAHLLRRKFVVIEKRNEAGDRPLKINVVFPERIVRVDEKGLGKQASGLWLLAFSHSWLLFNRCCSKDVRSDWSVWRHQT